MTPDEWMSAMKTGRAARRSIPLQLQASLPLVGRRGDGRAECWYYRLQTDDEGIRIWSPALYVLWDVGSMTILEKKTLEERPLGDGSDLITPAHRAKEDAYLEGLGDPADSAACASPGRPDQRDRRQMWLDAAPAALRPYLAQATSPQA